MSNLDDTLKDSDENSSHKVLDSKVSEGLNEYIDSQYGPKAVRVSLGILGGCFFAGICAAETYGVTRIPELSVVGGIVGATIGAYAYFSAIGEAIDDFYGDTRRL